MWRRVLTIAALLSASSCAASLVLWARSYHVADYLYCSREGVVAAADHQRFVGLVAWRGQLEFSFSGLERAGLSESQVAEAVADDAPGARTGLPLGLHWINARNVSLRNRPSLVLLFDGRGRRFRWSSFHRRDGSRSVSASGLAVTVPIWGVAVALLALPSGRLWQFQRLRKARRCRAAGQCPSCGYDLRATPDRCPECGTVPGEGSRPGA